MIHFLFKRGVLRGAEVRWTNGVVPYEIKPGFRKYTYLDLMPKSRFSIVFCRSSL